MSFEHDPEPRGIHELGTQKDLENSVAWAEKRGYPVERTEQPEPVQEQFSAPEPEPEAEQESAPAPEPVSTRSPDPLSPSDHWRIRAANRQAAEAKMAQERAAAEAARAAQPQTQAAPPDEEPPDLVLEPEKFFKWQFERSDYARRLEQAEYQNRVLAMTIAGQNQVAQANRERQQEIALVAQMEEAYASRNPTYHADVDAWFSRTKQGFIDGMGMDEYQADATAKAEVARYLDLARRTGKDPAALMHSLSRGMAGVQPPAPRQNPARIAKAQAHAAGGVGVSTSPQPLNPAAMAVRGMTRDELTRIKREMGPKAGVRAAIAALDFINAQG